MKRAFTLLEVLVVLALLAILVPALAYKLPQAKARYLFSHNHTMIEEALFEAELLAILTSKTTAVICTKEEEGWMVRIDPLSKEINFPKKLKQRMLLKAVHRINGQESGELIVQFVAPFGQASGLPLMLESAYQEVRACHTGLTKVTIADHPHIFNEGLIQRLETSI